MDTERMHWLARSQRGLLADRQARELDLHPSTLRSRFVRGGWQRVAPGVWLAPGAPVPPDLGVRAAVLHVGAPVAVARWTAAALHGLHPSRPIIQLSVPAGRRARTLRRVQTLRTRHWREDDVVSVDGLPVTSMARTVRDLAPIADVDALRRLVIDARQQRLLDLPDLVEQVAISRGLAGRPKLVRVLRELDADLVDSEFERLVLRWLRGEGFDVVPQHPVRTADRVVNLDLALPDRHVAVECLGFGSHSLRRHLTVDSKRTKAIEDEGWRVLPLTWDEFTSDRAAFLRSLVRARGTPRPERVP